jgi:hypothetical protein
VRHVVVAALVWVLLAVALSAQTATLSGYVTDGTGALISGAVVIVAAAGTGVERRLRSDAAGYFAAPYLPPGQYEIRVTYDGFRSFVAAVTLNVDSRARVDAVLSLPGPEESVRVVAPPPAADRESAGLSMVIGRPAMTELPLNGRMSTSLVLLGPGATESLVNGSPGDGVHINGNRAFQNSVLVDGIDNNMYTFGPISSTEVMAPPLEALEETRVATATYGAEYGRASGGIVNMITRSGSNDFHGSAFEYYRDDNLEATEYFAGQAGLPAQPLRFDQFGGSLGGPAIRDRLFFFGSYQGTRNRSTGTETVTVPTAAQKQGHFGDTPIYDPTAVVDGVRQLFPANTIPPNRIDPVGQRFADLYPDPNRPGPIDNYVVSVGSLDARRNLDLRLDGRVGTHDRVFVRASLLRDVVSSDGLFPPPGNGIAQAAHEWTDAASFAFGATHIFSDTVVNDAHGGFTSNEYRQQGYASAPESAAFGLTGIPETPGITGLPNTMVAGFAPLGESTTALGPQTRVWQASDQVSVSRGRHLLRLGGDFWARTNVADNANGAGGALMFDGQFTSDSSGIGGSAVADLLLGQTSLAVLTTPIRGEFHDWSVDGYVSDTWRPASSLTLNLGLRYEFQTPAWEAQNRLSNFVLDSKAPGYGTLVAATPGDLLARTFITPDRNNVAPRLGAVYQPAESTLVRGAFGVFFAGPGYRAAPYTLLANPPNFVRSQYVAPFGAEVSPLVLSQGFPADALAASSSAAALVAEPSQFPTGSTRQWSVELERQLPGNVLVSLGYVGSTSANLPGFTAANAPPPGPGPVKSRRPFPDVGNITEVAPLTQASYNAMQVHAERRYASALGLYASYTWGHAIDNSSDFSEAGGIGMLLVPQDPTRPSAEKASADFDVRHRMTASLIYGPSDPGWSGGPHVLAGIVRGWQVSAIGIAESGVPMTPQLARNPANTTTPERPDCLADGNLPRDERSADRWFDAAAFAVPANFTYGNCGRNVLRAPGYVNVDVGVARSFRLGGGRLQLRADVFNIANTPHFSQPNLMIDLPAQAGRITATSAPPRQAQLGIRLSF